MPRHSGGQDVFTAGTVRGLHFLGSGVVAEKTNEIQAGRTLCRRLDPAFRPARPVRHQRPHLPVLPFMERRPTGGFRAKVS